MKIYNNSTPDTNIENSSGVVCIGDLMGFTWPINNYLKKQ